MKVFLDTNVYIAEALLGGAAESMLVATTRASWRIFVSDYVLDKLESVLTDTLGFSTRLARLTRRRGRRVRAERRLEPKLPESRSRGRANTSPDNIDRC